MHLNKFTYFTQFFEVGEDENHHNNIRKVAKQAIISRFTLISPMQSKNKMASLDVKFHQVMPGDKELNV